MVPTPNLISVLHVSFQTIIQDMGREYHLRWGNLKISVFTPPTKEVSRELCVNLQTELFFSFLHQKAASWDELSKNLLGVFFPLDYPHTQFVSEAPETIPPLSWKDIFLKSL